MQKGLVMRSTGSWYELLDMDSKTIFQARLRGKFKNKDLKVTNPIAVGDRVVFEQESDEAVIITDILERENYIIRKSVHKTAHGHMLASNIDQAILLATLEMPRTSLGFIDRFLVSAEAFRIPAKLVFNKIDRLKSDADEYLAYLRNIYEPLGYACFFVSALEHTNIKSIETLLSGKKTLVSGHSGVGKSTLINTLNPHLNLRTKEVSTFANKGVHTTTFAEMFELSTNTFIIDTPGIKELGLFDISKEELSHYFPEMRALLGRCKFHNCLHLSEPKCTVRKAVEDGKIAPERYNSYLSMLEDYDNRR